MANSAARHALVVGYGSIGKRHARVLQGLGFSVSIVSRRSDVDSGLPSFRTIDEAVANSQPDYAVIATETSMHAEGLRALSDAGCNAPVLIEKPLFAQVPAEKISGRANLHVGYQLRFHPAILRLRELIATSSNIAAQFYVGQYVDDWRPGRSVRDSYSGHAAGGGGVLRDLSHELDLALWLLGRCERVAALGGRFADVTADSDDAWGILACFERCPVVTIQLNYLDRISQRRIDVVTDRDTISVDLVAGTVKAGGKTEQVTCDPDVTLTAMHKAVFASNDCEACDFEGGMRVVELVDAVERAVRSRAWIVL